MPRALLRILWSAGSSFLATTPVAAHGFGQRYDLPLPLTLYLLGAASALVLSFAVFALLVRRAPVERSERQFDLLATPLGRWLAHPILVLALKLLAFALFALVIAAGLFGDQYPYRNIAPTFVWIVWWVGFAYVSVLLGNVWAVVNPLRTAFDAADWLRGRLGRGALSARVVYPQKLGVWPACALLFAFAWTELVYPAAAAPSHIAWLAIAYSILTWTGMALFGRDVWLRHGEVFSVLFGLFARFAPFDIRADEGRRQLLLRPFGAGLLQGGPVSPSMMAFVLLLLSMVLYDGFLATSGWSDQETALREALPALGPYADMIIRTAGLLIFWLVFLGAYLAICTVMSAVTVRTRAPLEIARGFALTLIPIAIGYHVAHYLVFLLVQGQYIIPLASDPFGFGWNLFGTADYRVDIAIAGARFSWYAALTAIVAGHVTAVYLAHVKAMREFTSRRAVLRSQVPLTALMVVYTFTGLSIIAEPITEQRAPAQPSVASETVNLPAQALMPEPATGLLKPVGEGKTAKSKITYRVLGSAFHDGTQTGAADILYAYAFAYRWGARGDTADARYDPSVDAATALLRKQLVGVQVVTTDTASKSFRVGEILFERRIIVVDVYSTVAPENPEQDATVQPPWSTLPWHLVVLMEEGVGRGWAAFSQAEAERRGVPWLDLVRSPELNAKLAALVSEFERSAYRPEALRSLVTADEARKRWAALGAFYRERGHFLVTNGPYLIKKWSGDGVLLEAFRDLTYPLGVGSYDAYAVPRRGFVTGVAWNGARATIAGDIEVIAKAMRSYKLVRTPIDKVQSDVFKRAAPECRYMVVDEAARVVLEGNAPLGEGHAFQVDFTGRLPPGRYTMFATIAPNGNMMNAEIRRIPVVIPDQPANDR